MILMKFFKIKNYLPIRRYVDSKKFNNCVPSKPTWDLLQTKDSKSIESQIKIYVKKLEKLSMLTIEKNIEKDLKDAINVVERMCNAQVETTTKSLVYYDYLGSCMLREDDEKCSPTQPEQNEILQNAVNKYDEYFVAPATSSASSNSSKSE